jgi:hypothetical protein
MWGEGWATAVDRDLIILSALLSCKQLLTPPARLSQEDVTQNSDVQATLICGVWMSPDFV